jgi:hypothetical protein
MLLEPGAWTVEKVGDRASVKGGSHHFTYRRLAPASGQAKPLAFPAPEAQPVPVAQVVDFEPRETAREKKARVREEDVQLLERLLSGKQVPAPGGDVDEEDLRILQRIERGEQA